MTTVCAAARMQLLLAGLVVFGTLWAVSSAAADVTKSDGEVQVTLVGAINDPDGTDIDSPSFTPDFQIQSLGSGLGEIDCQLNGEGPLVPCGGQGNLDCSAACTYSSTVAAGFNSLIVFYYGGSASLTFDFQSYGDPPQTTLVLPLKPADNMDFIPSMEHPQFEVQSNGLDPLPVTEQCMLTRPPSAPGQWGSCTLPRLGLRSVYDLRVRYVDVFGRPDPSPPSYIFSPTPCRARIRGPVPTMAHIFRHGLPVTASCVQPGKFEVSLDLPQWYVSYWGIPSRLFGLGDGHTNQTFQTVNLKVRMLHGIPAGLERFLTSRRVPIQVWANPLADYGAPYAVPYHVAGRR